MLTLAIPIYNAAKYLDRCLDSVKSQTLQEFECLLVDDGSTDSSLSICQRHSTEDSRFKVIHKKHGGVSSARNLALEHASGTNICWLDADDVISPYYLQGFLDDLMACSMSPSLLIQQHSRQRANEAPIPSPSVRLDSLGLYSAMFLFSLDKSAVRSSALVPSDFFSSCQLGSLGVSVSKLFDLRIIRTQHLKYNEDIVLAEDLDFLLRYLCHCESVLVTQTNNYTYLLRSDSASTTIYGYQTELQGLNQINSSWSQLYSRYQSDALQSLWDAAVADYLQRVIVSCYKTGMDREERLQNLRSIPSRYFKQYGVAASATTPFLRLSRFLVAHHLFALLDLLYAYTFRYYLPKV